MNWGKIKIIIIILLTLVNVFFIYNINLQNKNIYYIDGDTIQTACDILAKDNVIVDKDIIPDEKLLVSVLESVFNTDYHDFVVSKISGTENYTKRIINNGVEFNIAKNNDIYIFDDTDILYIKYISNDFPSKTLNVLEIENEYNEIAESKLSGYDKIIKSYLMWDKDNQSSAFEYDIIVTKGYHDDVNNRYFLYCIQTINSQPTNECEFVAVVYNNTVQFLEGKVMNNIISKSYQTTLIDQVNILFMEKADIIENRQVDTDIYTVMSLSSEYYINWNQERDIMFLIPAWRILYDDGSTTIRDAINGSVY